MGGDGVDAQVPMGVPPPGGTMDHGADGKTQVRQIIGLPLVRVGNGSCGDTPHRGIHKETSGNHSGKGCLPPHL